MKQAYMKCKEQLAKLEKDHKELNERRLRTLEALWQTEDTLEEYAGQEQREEELVDEVINLKRQVVFANKQITKLKSK